MNPLTQFKNTTILPVLIALTLGCFGLSPGARAVTPAPDGGYPNFNTAEGTDALFSLTSGSANTALGFNALYSTTTGFQNTATGSGALASNTTGNYNTALGFQALYSNTTGGLLLPNNALDWQGNTATGYQALYTTPRALETLPVVCGRSIATPTAS